MIHPFPRQILLRARFVSQVPGGRLYQVRAGLDRLLHQARRWTSLQGDGACISPLPGRSYARAQPHARPSYLAHASPTKSLQHEGCTKAARDMFFCAGHGGGRRCQVIDCAKGAVGSSAYCTGHGGGRRCSAPSCQKSAQSGTEHCVRHGGGRKATMAASAAPAAGGRTVTVPAAAMATPGAGWSSVPLVPEIAANAEP